MSGSNIASNHWEKDTPKIISFYDAMSNSHKPYTILFGSADEELSTFSEYQKWFVKQKSYPTAITLPDGNSYTTPKNLDLPKWDNIPFCFEIVNNNIVRVSYFVNEEESNAGALQRKYQSNWNYILVQKTA